MASVPPIARCVAGGERATEKQDDVCPDNVCNVSRDG